MAKTIPLGPASVVKTISGNSPMVRKYPEAANQTFVVGELVYLSSGYVTECGDNPSLILGMAAENAHNDSTAGKYMVSVYIANDDTIFEFNKVTTAGAGTATDKTDVGKSFSIYRDTTNNRVHAATGSAGRLMCIALSDKDDEGDIGGRLECMVMGSYRQLFSTS